LTTQLHKI
jgi:hypothetical protein